MIINDRFRFVFVHIPKCGGTTVRSVLAPFDERKHVYFLRGRHHHSQLGFLDYHHIPLALLRDYFREDFECVRNYASFVLTRDPFTRFPSSLLERMIWRGKNPQALTSREVAREVDEAIEYLSDPCLKLPVTEPDFIHFGRQVDYTDIDGERIVDNIYQIERLPEMLRHIGELAGVELQSAARENERFYYKKYALQQGSTFMQKAIMASIPRRIWKPIFSTIKHSFLETGVLNKWRHWHADVFNSDKVGRFIAEFYENDIRLHRPLLSEDTTLSEDQLE